MSSRRGVTDLANVSAEFLEKDILASLFDGVPYAELLQAPIMASRMRIEEEPNYESIVFEIGTMMVKEMGWVGE